jgi:hypothetical protein
MASRMAVDRGAPDVCTVGDFRAALGQLQPFATDWYRVGYRKLGSRPSCRLSRCMSAKPDCRKRQGFDGELMEFGWKVRVGLVLAAACICATLEFADQFWRLPHVVAFLLPLGMVWGVLWIFAGWRTPTRCVRHVGHPRHDLRSQLQRVCGGLEQAGVASYFGWPYGVERLAGMTCFDSCRRPYDMWRTAASGHLLSLATGSFGGA